MTSNPFEDFVAGNERPTSFGQPTTSAILERMDQRLMQLNIPSSEQINNGRTSTLG